MTLLDKLQAHKGGLIRLKPPLYWYGSRSYDNNPGRICLILDAADADGRVEVAADAATRSSRPPVHRGTAAFLLIDGQPRWVWVVEADVELL